MRRTFKHILIAALYYSGLLALYLFLFKPSVRKTPLILMFHQVFKNPEKENILIQDGLHVSQDTFDKQLSYLKKKYNVISLSQLVELLEKHQSLPKKTAVITFDDGWRDNYQYAYPVLKKHNLPAIIFITTDFIESQKIFWFLEAALLHQKGRLSEGQFYKIFEDLPTTKENLPETSSFNRKNIKFLYHNTESFLEFLKQFDSSMISSILDRMSELSGFRLLDRLTERWMLNWDEIKAMTDLVEIGSHGCSHRIMTRLRPEEIMKELTASKKIIEEKTGQPVSLFAYPNGDYSAEIEKMVCQAGYRAAIATSQGPSSPDGYELFAIKRLGVHEGMAAGIGGCFSRALFYFAINRRKNIL
ncbi:MAG: polysaccharide deacetylase family protein [candidate division Zixibacteria bacterium]|nr:polysaccharide deacetylase family protein [candidate division Zixibacteria bacterium]